jgi:hypothetical protein
MERLDIPPNIPPVEKPLYIPPTEPHFTLPFSEIRSVGPDISSFIKSSPKKKRPIKKTPFKKTKQQVITETNIKKRKRTKKTSLSKEKQPKKRQKKEIEAILNEEMISRREESEPTEIERYELHQQIIRSGGVRFINKQGVPEISFPKEPIESLVIKSPIVSPSIESPESIPPTPEEHIPFELTYTPFELPPESIPSTPEENIPVELTYTPFELPPESRPSTPSIESPESIPQTPEEIPQRRSMFFFSLRDTDFIRNASFLLDLKLINLAFLMKPGRENTVEKYRDRALSKIKPFYKVKMSYREYPSHLNVSRHTNANNFKIMTFQNKLIF